MRNRISLEIQTSSVDILLLDLYYGKDRWFYDYELINNNVADMGDGEFHGNFNDSPLEIAKIVLTLIMEKQKKG